MILTLTNKYFIVSHKIVEDVLVKVEIFMYPIDFVIIFIE